MFFSENIISAELLGVFKIKREKYVNIKSHGRSYDSISIRISGRGEFKTNDSSFAVKRGDILYLPRDLDYTQKSDSETLIAIHFLNYGFKKGNNAEVITVDDIEYIEKTVIQMYDVWKQKKQGHQYKCTALLYELLYHINCQQHNQIIKLITHDSKIKNAIDYMHSNFRNNVVEISELAKMCSISETYFRKLFKKIHGVAPSQYLINLKLEFASHLIRSQLYTVSEAAYKSGFNDTKYFIKLFKRHYGATPKEYQNNSNMFDTNIDQHIGTSN